MSATNQTFTALYVPHNEGCVAAIVTGPGFDAGHQLVDLYEVDAEMRSFATLAETYAFLSERGVEESDLKSVAGGFLAVE